VDVFPARSDDACEAPVSLAVSISLPDLRKSCAAVHEAIVLCARIHGHEVGLMMRLHAPKKEMRYKYLDKIDCLEVEIVHILAIITVVTHIHGKRRKSRHKAKITVITAIVNS